MKISGQVAPNSYWVVSSVENVSGRDVSVYAIRQTPGENLLGLCGGHMGHMPYDKALRPGQKDGNSAVPTHLRATYEIDFVEFTDGTTWGADTCHIAEYLAGERAGGAAAATRLLGLLATGGPDAVTQAVTEELTGWGLDAMYKEAIRLGLAKRGPDGVLRAVEEKAEERHLPNEHSPVWEMGYIVGKKMIAGRVQRAVAVSGPGEIEAALRLPYDAVGAR
jgi:hypothetical protein